MITENKRCELTAECKIDAVALVAEQDYRETKAVLAVDASIKKLRPCPDFGEKVSIPVAVFCRSMHVSTSYC